MKNNLLKKFTTLSIGSIVGLVIGIISTPIITRLFSPEEFAKASMFNLAINILMILVMFGTDQAYVRFFYEEKEEKRGYLLKNILKIPIIVSAIIGILLFVTKKKVSDYLFGEQYNNLIYLLIISITIYVVNKFAVLVIRMEQRGKVFSILQICLKLFELIGILLFVKLFGKGFENLVYARVLTMLLVGLIAIYYGINHWKFLKRGIETKHSMKEIINYSSPLVLMLLVFWLFQSFDRFAIKEWSTMKELGIYVAAFRIVAILTIVQTMFSTFWTPVAFQHYENFPEDKKFYSEMTKRISILMMLIAVGTIMFKNLIILLLDETYRSAAMIMPFLIFMPIMFTISETTVVGISFKKKTKWHLVIAVVSCIFNVIGNYLLVPIYGAKGAAISTGLAYIVFFTLRTYFSLKYYKVDYNLNFFYFYTLLLVAYAMYNTFVDNWLVSTLSGILIILLILGTDIRFIKKEINYLKTYIV